MDTATSVIHAAGPIVEYVAQRALDCLVDTVVDKVIRQCSDKRARTYFRQLAEEMAGADATLASPERIASLLDEVTKNEPARETVFEYYRQSVLSRSKELGPRLLALLAARLIQEKRVPTSIEQEIAEIAEVCTDDDFAQFIAYYTALEDGTMPEHDAKVRASQGTITVLLDQAATRAGSASTLPAGPMSLTVELGRWAAKLESIGAIQQLIDTSIRNTGLHRDESDEVRAGLSYRTEWRVHFTETCQELNRLLLLATAKTARS